jgi:hypothetical protein
MSIALDGTNGVTMPVGSQSNASVVAWANFNGTATSGSATIRASYNITSITINSTGNYTANFTNAIQDANYAFVGTMSPSTGITNIPRTNVCLSYATAPTTTQIVFFTGDSANGNFANPQYVSFAVFR